MRKIKEAIKFIKGEKKCTCFTAIVFGVIARQFFIEDQKGKPLTYTSNFLIAYRKISIMKYVFPSLEAITLSEEVYRGES